MKSRRAFTFIEVMLVVVMIGILLAVVLPNMAGVREKTALKTAAKDISAGGILARQLAVAYGRPTALAFDPEAQVWNIDLDPKTEDASLANWRKRGRRDDDMTSDERERPLPPRVKIATLRQGDVDAKLTEPLRLTFYPNGSCSGLAIELVNSRDRRMTVDFSTASGQPEVYIGSPKSQAEKLVERGLNPEDYGLERPASATVAAADTAGAGFKQTAGWTEEERVAAYSDVAARIAARSRALYETTREGGPAAYYQDVTRWGGN